MLPLLSKDIIGKNVIIEDTSKNIYKGVLIRVNEDTAVIETNVNVVIIYNLAFISYAKPNNNEQTNYI